MERLLLGGHLGVGIPPGAQFQPPADPAQPFGRIRSALAGAHRAKNRLAKAIGLDSPFRFLEKLFGYHRVHDHGLRRRPGSGGAFALHNPTIAARPR